MAHVISILNPKGGPGKSTLATNLATYWTDEGRSVLLIDTDIQGTSSKWSESSDVPVSTINGERQLITYVERMKERFDLILIDGSAKLEAMLVPALKTADLVVIPVRPSNADVWATADLVELVKTRQKLTEGLPRAVFVITQQVQHSVLSEGIQGVLEAFELPVLSARTALRVAYAEALSQGSGVTRYEQDGKASIEIQQIAHELESYLH